MCHVVGVATQGTSWGQHLKGIVWGVSALTCSLLDWPLRNISRGKLAATTRAVRSSTEVSRLRRACLPAIQPKRCGMMAAASTMQMVHRR